MRKPARVAKIHRRICASKSCPHLETLDYHDPCVGCPERHFAPYILAGCNGEIPEPALLPSTGTMLKNAVASVGAVIRHGIKKVSDEEKARRLEICQDCEFHDKIKNRCVKCGCFLKWKTALETWHCPIKKW